MSIPFEVQPYARRRAALLKAMGEGVAVVPTAPEVSRNRDTHYLYRHDSYFYYLTGFAEPEATVVLVGGKKPKVILFCREKDEEREIWDGFRYGPGAAREVFGFDEAYPIAQLGPKLVELLSNVSTVFTPVGMSAQWDAVVSNTINAVRAQSRSGVWAPDAVVDVRRYLDPMRLVKDSHEIAIMRRAAEISSEAHHRAMRASKPGMFEYEAAAELMHEFVRNGGQTPAYSNIVASGPNSCVLHYNTNDRRVASGDLLLIDAGCEYLGYASDITRTFPVNGKFTGEQKAIYEAVLKANLDCMEELKAGKPFNAYHDRATRSLSQSLIDLGILKGSLDSVLEKETFKQFYMHRAGHWLGMDVHDAGDYRVRGEWQSLKAGMVVTNEPGLYIRPAKNVNKRWWNIGVRIEDDVLITKGKPDVLTKACVKTVADVEAMCSVR